MKNATTILTNIGCERLSTLDQGERCRPDNSDYDGGTDNAQAAQAANVQPPSYTDSAYHDGARLSSIRLLALRKNK